jgi:hypothetical protein
VAPCPLNLYVGFGGVGDALGAAGVVFAFGAAAASFLAFSAPSLLNSDFTLAGAGVAFETGFSANLPINGISFAFGTDAAFAAGVALGLVAILF